MNQILIKQTVTSAKTKFEHNFPKDKNYRKVKDHFHFTGKYRGATHSICNLKCSMPKEILVVFDNGSNYDYHFIIKELAKDFEGKFNCLGENIEKYKIFSVPITCLFYYYMFYYGTSILMGSS